MSFSETQTRLLSTARRGKPRGDLTVERQSATLRGPLRSDMTVGAHSAPRRSNSRPDLTVGGHSLSRNDAAQYFMSGNGFQSEFNDGYTQTTTFSRNSQGGGGGRGGQIISSTSVQKQAQMFYQECMGCLNQAQIILEANGPVTEVDKQMNAAADLIEQMEKYSVDLYNAGQPNDIIIQRYLQRVIVFSHTYMKPVSMLSHNAHFSVQPSPL